MNRFLRRTFIGITAGALACAALTMTLAHPLLAAILEIGRAHV